LWWSWLAVVVVVGTVGAADDVDGSSHARAGRGRGQEAPSLGIELRGVELWREPVPTIRLHASGPLAPRVRALAASGDRPARLSIDIPARATARVPASIPGAGIVRAISVDRTSPRETTLTVALAGPSTYRMRAAGRLVTIAFDAPRVAATDAPQAKPAAPAATAHASVEAEQTARGDGELAIAIERGGARFVWPDLDAPCYADPVAAVERLALKGWRQGGMTPDAPANHVSPAGRLLAADVSYLRTLMGQMEPLDAIAAYDRALRAGPRFPDAPRALTMIGFASLRLGLAPEADTAFARVAREHAATRYRSIAIVGRAMALRARRRFDEARALLASMPEPVPANLRCDVLVERAALARAGAAHADAVALDETLARDCPRVTAALVPVAARADSLVAIGRRVEARALLERAAEGLDVEEQATALRRAADLAREDGDAEVARRLLERVLGARIGAATRLRVQADLARVDAAGGDAERAIASLEALAASASTASLRVELVGVLAETLADAGRFEDALARLRAPDAHSPDDEDSALAHRDAILARWIARLAAVPDAVGIVVVYGRHRTAIDTHAASATSAQVARALVDTGLAASALRVLRLRQQDDEPAYVLALAEAALGAGELRLARESLARLRDVALADPLAVERRRLAARLEVADGHPERVVVEPDVDAPLARAVAVAWTARGDAAVAGEAWDAAADAYARATTLAPDATTRLLAEARLVELRVSRGTAPSDGAVDRLTAVDDPVVRRAADLVAATRTFGTTVVPVGAVDGR
jgi:tetratricopeptide (TPR) repeat protein